MLIVPVGGGPFPERLALIGLPVKATEKNCADRHSTPSAKARLSLLALPTAELGAAAGFDAVGNCAGFGAIEKCAGVGDIGDCAGLLLNVCRGLEAETCGAGAAAGQLSPVFRPWKPAELVFPLGLGGGRLKFSRPLRTEAASAPGDSAPLDS